MNNNGRNGASRTAAAPGVVGMVEAISRALHNADVQPDTLGYVEAQGNANPRDDAAELLALNQIFARSAGQKPFCALGSLKPNIGDLAQAAGIAGLIKIALALAHKQIPPLIDCEIPRPELANSPFYINTQLLAWSAGSTPRRAAVNGFGQGRVNIHIVLEEAPPLRAPKAARAYQLLMLSAKTPTALEAARSASGRYCLHTPRGQADFSAPPGAGLPRLGGYYFRFGNVGS